MTDPVINLSEVATAASVLETIVIAPENVQTFAPAPTVLPLDEYSGQGGSYLLDAATGRRAPSLE